MSSAINISTCKSTMYIGADASVCKNVLSEVFTHVSVLNTALSLSY